MRKAGVLGTAAFLRSQLGPGQPGGAADTRWQQADDSRFAILADARIDARTDLAAALGCAPDTDDPRLILAAWRKWGAACLDHLLGDFAFVIHDRAQGRLFCARDHVGARPFHYHLGPERFAFGGSLAALHGALPDLDEPDHGFLATLLVAKQCEPSDRTAWRAIRRLPPGHWLEVSAASHRVVRYWRPEAIGQGASRPVAALVEEARDLLGRATADRLRGARHCGLHVSGGLDSSAIAALAVAQLQASAQPAPLGFSWHYDPALLGSDPVSDWTHAMIGALGIETLAPPVLPATFAALIRADGTHAPDARQLLHEAGVQECAAARGIDVILSGYGGDEGLSFNGRGLAARLLRTGRWRELADLSPRGGLPGLASGLRWAWRERRNPPARAASAAIARSYIDPGFARTAEFLPPAQYPHDDPRQALLAQFANRTHVGRLEAWAESGAAAGLAYRYPLLDRRILEFALGLPPELFWRRGETRWFMHQVVAGLVPDVVSRNQSKLELLRVDRVIEIARVLMPQIGHEISARRGTFARGHLIDLDRLVRDLVSGDCACSGRFGHAMVALQVLDL